MPTIAESPSTTLYYRSGSSDKVYQARVEPSGDGFVVNFAFGRRGSTLTTGTKTAGPVDLATAQKIYDKLVAEKTSKGYTPGEDGTPYQNTSREDRNTGIVPQLLNAIDEAQAEQLLADPAWCCQEKLDGKRILILRKLDQIIGINRSGLVVALPAPILAAAQQLGSQQWLLDGEAIGDVYWAFDLLESACVNLRAKPYRERLKAMYELSPVGADQPIRFVQTATTAAKKRAMLADLKKANKEGIVFKKLDAPYTPGRPASGGDQLKLKFTASATCLVTGAKVGKRSVALELRDGTRRVPVGNVTIPANQPIPAAGSIVEVKFLYAYPGGSLFQPVYLGRRDDVGVEACVLSQLKYKPTGDEAEG